MRWPSVRQCLRGDLAPGPESTHRVQTPPRPRPKPSAPLPTPEQWLRVGAGLQTSPWAAELRMSRQAQPARAAPPLGHAASLTPNENEISRPRQYRTPPFASGRARHTDPGRLSARRGLGVAVLWGLHGLTGGGATRSV